jgi:cysteinyl-tRNA synthetase
MKLHNTLSRTKEEFRPQEPGHITLYTCGPTVYHYYHIGNLRNAVFNDTLKRVLELDGAKVQHIMNITDVGHLTGDIDSGDDKLQSRAAEEGKTVWEVAEFYTEAFKHDMQALNILAPQKYVPATSAIEQQIRMVEVLIDNGFAYQTEQAIYFDVTKPTDYGKLTGQSLGQKEVGVRDEVVTDPDKHHPQDFALWFFTIGRFARHAMHWPSPWGEGFPGWHLECSAIIERELDTTIDIHTGGVDLIGTHHTNEIAQSEAAHDGAPLANYWVHIEFLLVDGDKMSKSLRNTYTMQDVTEGGYDPLALRMLYLQSHYRSQQNFTWQTLEGANAFLERLQAWSDGQYQVGSGTLSDATFSSYRDQITKALEDDLGTPQAVAIVSEIVDHYEKDFIAPTPEQVGWVEQVFGLRLDQRQDLTPEQKVVLRERQAARDAKDFTTADAARSALAEQHIEVEDTPQGPRWRRLGQVARLA